jgi:endonuclease/exonuclease/phosphatase family metal-dependent hydrolase
MQQPHEVRLRKLGYAYMQTVSYQDGGPVRQRSEVEMPSMRLMSKLPFIHTAELRLGGLRNAIDVVIDDPETGLPIRVIGIHLDDRNEEFRLRQVEDLELLIANSDIPVVLLGDFNAMYGDSLRAKFMRSRFARLIAETIPNENMSDFAVRATDMATGTTMARLTAPGMLIDADSLHLPTATPKVRGLEYLPSLPLIGIDHILHSPELKSSGHEVGAHDSGSDHRSVKAKISRS